MPKRKTARTAEANACLSTRRKQQPPSATCAAANSTLWEVDQIRRDVEFALTRQPGEESAALTGDGHSVVEISWFEER